LEHSSTTLTAANTKNIQNQSKPIELTPNAVIIPSDCKSLRFNVKKQSIELVFPIFLNISYFLSIQLNDSRIHSSSLLIHKEMSSNLLKFELIKFHNIQKLINLNGHLYLKMMLILMIHQKFHCQII
jgi:hypothetical protein